MTTDHIPSEKIANRLGYMADALDNLHAATLMPLPADFHLPIIQAALLEKRDELRKLYEDITGENIWTL